MYKNIFSLISGIVFGIGLTIGGMTNPAKVIAFLNITKNWDPSLIFVMGGAIAFVLPSFYLLRNKEKPIFASSYQIPKSKNIDQNNKGLNLKLLAIDLLKNKDKFEINLIFNNNSCITLSTEIVEVTLEDQNKI